MKLNVTFHGNETDLQDIEEFLKRFNESMIDVSYFESDSVLISGIEGKDIEDIKFYLSRMNTKMSGINNIASSLRRLARAQERIALTLEDSFGKD